MNGSNIGIGSVEFQFGRCGLPVRIGAALCEGIGSVLHGMRAFYCQFGAGW